MSKLPPMQCDKGCGACCGPVACSESEYTQLTGFARNHGIEPLAQGITCPFYQDGACVVYEVRPHVCRVFGHFKELACERGYNTNVSPGQQTKMERDYRRRIATEPVRWLHESVYTPDQIAAILKDRIEGLQVEKPV